MTPYDDFVEKMWITNPDALRDEAHAVFGLAEEMGELAGKYIEAEASPGEHNAEKMLGELGDIMFYLTKVAHLNGYGQLDIAEFPDEEQMDVTKSGAAFFMLSSAVGEVVGRYKRRYRPGDADFTHTEMYMLLREVFRCLAVLSFRFGFCPGAVIRYNTEKLEGRHERGTLTGTGDDR